MTTKQGTLAFNMSSNASVAAAKLKALGVEGPRQAGNVTIEQAKRMKAMLQANAPVGDPKRSDRKVGHYRNSFHYRTRKVGSGRSATVWTTADYGRRLEFGFSGQTDALGRFFSHWETTPKPHWQPVVDEIERENEAKYAAALLKAARIVAAGFPG